MSLLCPLPRASPGFSQGSHLPVLSPGGLTGNSLAHRVPLLAAAGVMAACFFKASIRGHGEESLARWNLL